MIFKDTEMLAEAYTTVLEKKCTCKHAAKGCKCNGCKDCKCNQKKKELKEAAKEKPDYLDVDEDGDKKESLKKALSDKTKKKEVKEEGLSSFRDLYQQIMEEHDRMSFGPSPYSNTFEHDRQVMRLRKLSNGEINKINDKEQYIVTWKNPESHNNLQEQPLKGESVHAFLDDVASIRKAFVKQH